MQESDFETAFVEGIVDSGKEIDLFLTIDAFSVFLKRSKLNPSLVRVGGWY